MLYSWWTLPSPGSRIRFHTWQITQPLSSSIVYHSMGNSGMSLPGYSDMVFWIHS